LTTILTTKLAAVLVTKRSSSRYRLLLHRSGYVGIQVQRDADLAVPEHLADHFEMDVQLKQQRRGAVGIDVRLPLLSTSLGHVSPKNT
jgi:hypothetical protein